jgi:hypothetical protein
MRRALRCAARVLVTASAIGLVGTALAQTPQQAASKGGKWPAAHEEKPERPAYVTTGMVVLDDEVTPPAPPVLKPVPLVPPAPPVEKPPPAPPPTDVRRAVIVTQPDSPAPPVVKPPPAPPPSSWASLPPAIKTTSIATPPAALPMPTPPVGRDTTAVIAKPTPLAQQPAPKPLPLVQPASKSVSVTEAPTNPAAALAPAQLPPVAATPAVKPPGKRIQPLPNNAASKLRYQIETVCGREAWEVQVVVKPDQLMHVKVKVADVEASGALAEKIKALPEMAAPNVLLEIEPFNKTIVVPGRN